MALINVAISVYHYYLGHVYINHGYKYLYFLFLLSHGSLDFFLLFLKIRMSISAKMNEQYAHLAGHSIVILKTAVRGVHVYKEEPDIGTCLTLSVEKGSKFKHAVLVKLKSNGKTVGHVAKEHARLVSKWII